MNGAWNSLSKVQNVSSKMHLKRLEQNGNCQQNGSGANEMVVEGQH